MSPKNSSSNITVLDSCDRQVISQQSFWAHYCNQVTQSASAIDRARTTMRSFPVNARGAALMAAVQGTETSFVGASRPLRPLTVIVIPRTLCGQCPGWARNRLSAWQRQACDRGGLNVGIQPHRMDRLLLRRTTALRLLCLRSPLPRSRHKSFVHSSSRKWRALMPIADTSPLGLCPSCRIRAHVGVATEIPWGIMHSTLNPLVAALYERDDHHRKDSTQRVEAKVQSGIDVSAYIGVWNHENSGEFDDLVDRS